MKSLLKKLIILLLLPFLRLLDLILPKSKRKILFYSKGGLYHNNPKYLFEYIIKHYPNWLPIWITSNEKTKNYLTKNFGSEKVLDKRGIKGLLLLFYNYMTSSVMIIRGGTDLWEIRKLFSIKRRIVIDLCHGVPIKKTGILFHKSKKAMKNEIRRRRHVTYHTVSSDIEKYFLSASYYVNIYNFPITGDPRNDIIFDNLKKRKELYTILKKKLKSTIEIDTIILYAPTHRDGATSDEKSKIPIFFPFEDFNEKSLREFLEKNKILLLLRAHDEDDIFGGNRFIVDSTILQDQRIKIFSHKIYMDINEIFPIVDILITDYSGIYLDFLLLNKPIIFLPYDLDTYKKEGRGLLFKYDLITPGPKIFTQKEFLNEISNYIKNPLKDEEKRIYLKNLFHNYQDNNSSKRVVDLFKHKLI